MFFVTYRRLRRLPPLWWLCSLAIAIVAGLLVTTAVADARASAARFEGLVPVYVATTPIDAGEVIDGSMVEKESWPRAFLSASPVEPEPIGKPAHVPVAVGEPLTSHKVASASTGPAAAQLREGEQGVAVPATDLTPAMQAGDLVNVLATMETSGDSFQPTTVVSSNARVLHMSETAITIAVGDDEAARVAFALARGDVMLALAAG